MNKVEAQFHTHQNCDEMFIVLDRELYIDFENDSICLKKGESFTMNAGTEHRARVPESASLIVIGDKDA